MGTDQNEPFTARPHVAIASIEKAIFGLWQDMEIQNKHKSTLHVVIYFDNFAAFRLFVIGDCLEQCFTTRRITYTLNDALYAY